MRLADFISSNLETVLVEWEAFARGISPGATMQPLALRDHAEDILRATVRDMRSSQSPTERTAKSRASRGATSSRLAPQNLTFVREATGNCGITAIAYRWRTFAVKEHPRVRAYLGF